MNREISSIQKQERNTKNKTYRVKINRYANNAYLFNILSVSLIKTNRRD